MKLNIGMHVYVSAERREWEKESVCLSATYAWIMCTDYYYFCNQKPYVSDLAWDRCVPQCMYACVCTHASHSLSLSLRPVQTHSFVFCLRVFVCIYSSTSWRRNPQQTRQTTNKNDFIIWMCVRAPDFLSTKLALKMNQKKKISQFNEIRNTNTPNASNNVFGSKMRYVNRVKMLWGLDFCDEETMCRKGFKITQFFRLP